MGVSGHAQQRARSQGPHLLQHTRWGLLACGWVGSRGVRGWGGGERSGSGVGVEWSGSGVEWSGRGVGAWGGERGGGSVRVGMIVRMRVGIGVCLGVWGWKSEDGNDSRARPLHSRLPPHSCSPAPYHNLPSPLCPPTPLTREIGCCPGLQQLQQLPDAMRRPHTLPHIHKHVLHRPPKCDALNALL